MRMRLMNSSVYSPDGRKAWSWTSPKTGPEALSGSLMCVAGAQTCGLCFSGFPRSIAGSWTVVEPVPTGDASAAGGSCARCIVTPVPCFNFYQHVASSS